MSRKINLRDKSMMYDAATMLKSVFVEFYTAEGFDPQELEVAWHDFRSSTECKKFIGKPMRYQAPLEKAGHKPDEPPEEQKQEIQQAIQSRKAQNNEPKISKSNPKLQQVKELYESGVVKAKDIAEKMGISRAYANNLLKKVKK